MAVEGWWQVSFFVRQIVRIHISPYYTFYKTLHYILYTLARPCYTFYKTFHYKLYTLVRRIVRIHVGLIFGAWRVPCAG